MEKQLVLSVDIGTSSLRVLAFDAQGKLVPQVGMQVAYEPQTTPDGGAFLDADWLLTQTVQAINGIVEQLGDKAHSIVAVATCTVWHSVLGVDKEGNAITPFLLWADSRCAREAEELKRTLNERNYHARTGCFLHPNFLPAKLLWFRRNFPEIASKSSLLAQFRRILALEIAWHNRLFHFNGFWHRSFQPRCQRLGR
jgi:gluconokinase